MNPRVRLALTCFATLAGLFSLLLYTTLVQDVFFKEVTFCGANGLQLGLMAMGIWAAGSITGFMTSLLVMQDNYWPHVALSIGVLAKTLFVVECEALANPLWFDALLNFSLLTGLWMGYYGAVKFPLSPA